MAENKNVRMYPDKKGMRRIEKKMHPYGIIKKKMYREKGVRKEILEAIAYNPVGKIFATSQPLNKKSFSDVLNLVPVIHCKYLEYRTYNGIAYYNDELLEYLENYTILSDEEIEKIMKETPFENMIVMELYSDESEYQDCNIPEEVSDFMYDANFEIKEEKEEKNEEIDKKTKELVEKIKEIIKNSGLDLEQILSDLDDSCYDDEQNEE